MYPRFHPLSYSGALETAKATVESLEALNLKGCFVGGLACHLYGNPRKPNDVDVVVLDLPMDCDLEQLKKLLVSQNPKFSLVASKNVFATYKVLWYYSQHGRCKVDVLKPGVMKIPNINPDQIEYISSLPVMPFSTVLLLKLQAWEDHKNAYREYLREKQFMDVTDINEMLSIAIRRGVKPCSEAWIPRDFILKAENRVKRYVQDYAYSRTNWVKIGFDV